MSDQPAWLVAGAPHVWRPYCQMKTAPPPVAVLLVPELLDSSALTPMAVLSPPWTMRRSASRPTAVFWPPVVVKFPAPPRNAFPGPEQQACRKGHSAIYRRASRLFD